MADGRDQLDILAFFHFAVGTMIAFVAVVPLLLGAVGASMAAPGGDAALRTEGARVTAVASFGCGVAVLALGLAAGAVVAFGGRCLMRRERWRVCVAAAGLACLFVPIGTLLGAVTLAALFRPEVRAAFADAG